MATPLLDQCPITPYTSHVRLLATARHGFHAEYRTSRIRILRSLRILKQKKNREFLRILKGGTIFFLFFYTFEF